MQLPDAKAAYAPVLGAGFKATATQVQEMHQAIAGHTFDTLQAIPGLGMPTLIVRSVHDAITHGVYAAVRHTGAVAASLAGDAERMAVDPNRVPGPKEQALRSALNGAFGDTLARSGSAIAVQMGLHDERGVFDIAGASPSQLQARVCVFLHGLGCDEQSWYQRSEAWSTSAWAEDSLLQPVPGARSPLSPGRAVSYGALLERESGVSALYLRYNSGQAIDHNAREFASLIERLSIAAPQVREWILIGHSMGGLVARRAHAIGVEGALGWVRHAPLIVCLGSPHQGAPLAKIGHLVSTALATSSVTRPLARLADSRSRGVKDLRAGLASVGLTTPGGLAAAPALRLIFATLADANGSADAGVGKLLSHWFGDGLVRPGSAADDGMAGDVQRVELPALGHMALLSHPRVYAVIRGWLGAPGG
jgi:pimeloyl-ACP methyl ester carboxylesterase